MRYDMLFTITTNKINAFSLCVSFRFVSNLNEWFYYHWRRKNQNQLLTFNPVHSVMISSCFECWSSGSLSVSCSVSVPLSFSPSSIVRNDTESVASWDCWFTIKSSAVSDFWRNNEPNFSKNPPSIAWILWIIQTNEYCVFFFWFHKFYLEFLIKIGENIDIFIIFYILEWLYIESINSINRYALFFLSSK